MEVFRQPAKDKGLLEACSEDIVLFSQYMLGMRLYAWQVYFLRNVQKAFAAEDGKREFIALTSRQIGKSTALAILSIWAAVFNKKPGTISNNTQIGIASASESQAKKLLYEMKKLLRIGDSFMKTTYHDTEKMECGSHFFTDLLDDKEPNNTTTITFKEHDVMHGEYLLAGSKTGSVIKSYPPTAIVLGETFSVVIIDEAGKSEKITDQFFYDYMYPTGNSTDAVRIYTSTPWVTSGFFYRLVDPDELYGTSPANVVVFTVQAIELEAPKYYATVMRTVAELEKDGKIDEIQRAYYCRFVKGSKSFFDSQNVFNIFNKNYEKFDSYVKPCDMGVDFGGQTTSRTVITISTENEQGEVMRLYDRVYQVGEDDNLLDDIQDLKSRFNIQRIIPDDCPQGDYMIRAMKERGWNIHPMNFRAEKVAKYTAFRSSLNRGVVFSYPDDDLQTEMLAMEFAEGRKQSVLQHAPGYSDDKIDSFIMSVYFYVRIEDGIKTFDFVGLSSGRNSDEECVCGSQQLERDNEDIRCMRCGRKWKCT